MEPEEKTMLLCEDGEKLLQVLKGLTEQIEELMKIIKDNLCIIVAR